MLKKPPIVLIPYDRRECLTVEQASAIAGRTTETVRRWCDRFAIGRRICGRWAVSHPALLMLLENNRQALAAYHLGHRQNPVVAAYFARAGVAV